MSGQVHEWSSKGVTEYVNGRLSWKSQPVNFCVVDTRYLSVSMRRPSSTLQNRIRRCLRVYTATKASGINWTFLHQIWLKQSLMPTCLAHKRVHSKLHHQLNNPPTNQRWHWLTCKATGSTGTSEETCQYSWGSRRNMVDNKTHERLHPRYHDRNWSSAWHNTARYNAAQHSTAQHSTAQHSTVQCSAVQPVLLQSQKQWQNKAQLTFNFSFKFLAMFVAVSFDKAETATDHRREGERKEASIDDKDKLAQNVGRYFVTMNQYDCCIHQTGFSWPGPTSPSSLNEMMCRKGSRFSATITKWICHVKRWEHTALATDTMRRKLMCIW